MSTVADTRLATMSKVAAFKGVLLPNVCTDDHCRSDIDPSADAEPGAEGLCTMQHPMLTILSVRYGIALQILSVLPHISIS